MSASDPGWTLGHRPPPDRAHHGHGNRQGGPAATPTWGHLPGFGQSGAAGWPCGHQCPPRPASVTALAARVPGVAREGHSCRCPRCGQLRVSLASSSAMSWCWGESRQVGAWSHRLPGGSWRGGPCPGQDGELGQEGGLTALGLDVGDIGPAARGGSEVAGAGQGLRGTRGPLLTQGLHTWPRETPGSSLWGREVGGATAPTAVRGVWTAQRFPVATAAFQHLVEGRGPWESGGWGGHAAWGGAAP